jgi:D-alanine--poly(phosphoribitol) ligase subunit 2
MMTSRAVDREGVLEAIGDAMHELQESGVETRGPLEASVETPLFGSRGMLDSLGLVQLIVLLENQLEDRYGASLTLADDRALSEKRSPFRTVGTLSDYVMKRLTS